MQKQTSLVLRTCSADMLSKNGFVWPGVGEMAEAPDWINNDECGYGLHGWLYGQGDHSCSSYLDSTAKWLVVEVESDHIVECFVFCGKQIGARRFNSWFHWGTIQVISSIALQQLKVSRETYANHQATHS